MVLVRKTPTEVGLAIRLETSWTVEAQLELGFLCVFMEAKNRFQCVNNCPANLHAELVDLLWLFFSVFGNFNLKLQVGWVNYQINWEDTICLKQDVVAITYISVRLP